MKKEFNDLFERDSDDAQFLEYVKKIKTKLNYKNFVIFFNFGRNLYSSHEFAHYERYIFILLKIWAMEHEEYEESYIRNFKFLIGKYHLKHRLYANEHEYINLFEEIIFNSKRNLKNIVVDFPISSNFLENEEIFYHIINVHYISHNLTNKGDIFISNSRIVFSTENMIFSISFKDISRYKLTIDGLKMVVYGNSYQFNPQNDDPRVLYVSFERIFNASNKR